MINEVILLKRLKQKKCSALQKAIDIYTPYISVVLFNMAGNMLMEEDIEEIVSDTFIALWKNASFIDFEKGSIKSYLAGAAKNIAAMKMRSIKPEYISIDDLQIKSDDNASEALIEHDKSVMLWKAVAELGEPDNEIFIRYYKYGEKIKNIASALDMNISTVKTKLARGKKKLKEKLSDMEGIV